MVKCRMFVYPFQGRNRVTVHVEDARRLSPGEFLNDNIIEFYIKYFLIYQLNCLRKLMRSLDIYLPTKYLPKSLPKRMSSTPSFMNSLL